MNGIEKWILRKSFDGKDYLPDEILWRQKEALSDGVGNLSKPFYKHIQERIKGEPSISDDDNERLFYYNLFYSCYDYQPITHYWMPRWVKTQNPSAREIQI
jgi:asparagine synthase (glutamine-hydrolysing)